MSIAEMFVTNDLTKDGKPITFNMIEDEYGDTLWAYGHIEPKAFISEVNRWLRHTMDDGDEFPDSYHVDHMYARQVDEWAERFDRAEAEDEGAFPVTRLWVYG